jgi:riboflavin kinase / FMN adenylyltransferase
MHIYHSFAEAANSDIQSLALGFFDGIHRGHQQVIANALDHDFAMSGGVLTFQTHPQSVISPANAPKLLTGLPHKLHDLKLLGVQHVLALPFNAEVAQISAEQFLQEFAAACPKLKRISIGKNWRFGHNRLGTITLLQEWCRTRCIQLIVNGFVQYQHEPISSSRIRNLVVNGHLMEASKLLGKPYTLFGTVAKGRQLGRELGFPTINLATLDQCLPPNGVYFGTVVVSGHTHPAAINIGFKPSIESNVPKISIEAHLLNFQGDLYDATVTIHPQKFWRSEQKFPSLAELKNQLTQDIAAARAFLTTH